MKFALWSREAVRHLIKARCGVVYSLPSMSVVLRRWGFTPQRPLKRAYEQRPAEVKQWLEQEYPKVREQAHREKAEIWWGDETAVKPECHWSVVLVNTFFSKSVGLFRSHLAILEGPRRFERTQ